MRVAHVITGLAMGGAEMMLLRLLDEFRGTPYGEVICLGADGPVGELLREHGHIVRVLNLPSDVRALLGIEKLRRALVDMRADVVHTWMYHANLLGGLAAKREGIPVIWALHSSVKPATTSVSLRAVTTALALLSRAIPQEVVSCSARSLEQHRRLGFRTPRMVTIPNGFDVNRFADPGERFEDVRASVRRRWEIEPDAFVIGHMGRFHPQKDHETLFRALAIVARRLESPVRLVARGPEITPENIVLNQFARSAGVQSLCRFLGPTTSPESEYPGFDVLVSSSAYGEAFPLVLGEAMASTIPCVTTDVGDSALIVGDESRVVPIGAPDPLATAILRIAALSPSARRMLGKADRARVIQNFSLEAVALAYTQSYARCVKDAL